MAYGQARREELARAKGFASYRAYRNAPRSEQATASKLLRERTGGSYAGKKVAPARKGWETLAPATQRRHKAEGITPALYRAGAPLHQAKGMSFVSGGEVVSVPIKSKAQRSLIGRYDRAAQIALDTGNPAFLRPFEGKKVGGFDLDATLGDIEDLDLRGEFDFEPYGDEAG